MQIELLIPLSGIIALIFAVFLSLKVMKEKPGNELMKEISNMIEQGAMTFLKREYSIFLVTSVKNVTRRSLLRVDLLKFCTFHCEATHKTI